MPTPTETPTPAPLWLPDPTAPDVATGFTPADSEAAQREGWCLIERDGGESIQCDDDQPEVLATDDDACRHVWAAAQAGVGHARRALAAVAATHPREWRALLRLVGAPSPARRARGAAGASRRRAD